MSLLAALLASLNLKARSQPLTVGFYNLENLFDTVNDADVQDGVHSRAQAHADGRGEVRYTDKLLNLAGAIALFTPDVLGVCEVESQRALDDLVAQRPLAAITSRWGTIHYDSQDPRGIDVGLIYRADRVRIHSSEPIRSDYNRPTRDMLRVDMEILSSGERMVMYVVHLPSRRMSDPKAAAQRKAMLVQLNGLVAGDLREDRFRGVMVCGDFNDNPNSNTMKRSLGALCNMAVGPYSKGLGSYVYQDAYLMYDQILVSHNLQRRVAGAQVVVRHASLFQQSGRFAFYPAKGTISDHLPVYLRVEPSGR